MSSRNLRPLAMALLGLAVALTACTDEPSTEPSPTISTETSSPATTSPSPTSATTPSPSPSPSPTATPIPSPAPSSSPSPASTAVPDDLSTITDDGEVTIAEAQAVIDVQNQIYNDAVVRLLTRPDDVTGPPGADFNAELSRIYTRVLLGAYGELWNRAATNGFESFNTTDPTGISETVQAIGEVRSSCFEVQIERNSTGISSEVVEPTTRWTSIATRPQVAASNPTGWYRNVETEDKGTTPLCDLESE